MRFIARSGLYRLRLAIAPPAWFHDRYVDRIEGEPPRPRGVAVPVAACTQSGRLVRVGRGGARRGKARRQADLAQRGLFGLSLVPRDGARVLRERSDRADDESALREH